MVPALKIVPDKQRHARPSHRPGSEQAAPTAATHVTKPIPDTHVSAPVRRKANLFVVLPLVGLLLLGAGLLFVGQRVQLMTLTYELDAARQQLVRLQQDNTRLQVAQATAASLDKMEATARVRLGMVEPGTVATVVLAPDAALTARMVHDTQPTTVAALGNWLQERLVTTAEAGERRP